jgi:hypothetical protein
LDYHTKNGSNFSQQGVVETTSLKPGDCFVVDAGHMRWISNARGTSPLVLLRATDGGKRYNTVYPEEQIRLDPALKKLQNKNTISRVSTMERLKEGLRQVKSMAKNYVTGGSTKPGQNTDGTSNDTS